MLVFFTHTLNHSPKLRGPQKGTLQQMEADGSGGDFIEVEMAINSDLFKEEGGDLDEIKPGKFVSYQYVGEYTPGGIPISPKLS